MKVLKNISALLLVTVFLLSSAGVIILRTSCTCTGNESLSLYVNPESCDEGYHTHHAHDDKGDEIAAGENQCHEGCSTKNDTEDCGCSNPEANYYKLVNILTNEEVKYITSYSEPIILNTFNDILFTSGLENQKNTESLFYLDPPPQINSSLDFLIQISQLKIPDLA